MHSKTRIFIPRLASSTPMLPTVSVAFVTNTTLEYKKVIGDVMGNKGEKLSANCTQLYLTATRKIHMLL